MALLAGNDILLFPDNVDAAVKGIRAAVADGTLPEALFESKVKKVLQAKFWLGLNVPQQVDLDNLYEDITPMVSQATKNQLIRDAITFIRPNDILPLQPQFTERSLCITVGKTQATPFSRMLSNYDQFSHLYISKDANADAYNTLYERAVAYDRIIVNVQDMSRFKSRDFGLTAQTIRLIERLPKEKLVVVLFNTPMPWRNSTTSAGPVGGSAISSSPTTRIPKPRNSLHRHCLALTAAMASCRYG